MLKTFECWLLPWLYLALLELFSLCAGRVTTHPETLEPMLDEDAVLIALDLLRSIVRSATIARRLETPYPKRTTLSILTAVRLK